MTVSGISSPLRLRFSLALYTEEETAREPWALPSNFATSALRLPQGRLLLDSISLSVEEGTTAAILGRSGSGKTTLLRTVNRMVLPTSGEVLLHGKNVSGF